MGDVQVANLLSSSRRRNEAWIWCELRKYKLLSEDVIVAVVIAIWTTANKPENKFRDFNGIQSHISTTKYRADKSWAMKRSRPSKKVWCSWLGSNYGPQIKETGTIKGISGNLRKMSYELKGFVNRLSHDCHIDIDCDVSTEYCRSSSVFKFFNNRIKSGRTKNIDIDNCFAYFTKRSTWVATR